MALVEAAWFERDRRAASYPRLVADQKLEADAATTDYQCWCAIAEWLETGSCSAIGSWAGLADPPVAVMSWPLIEECALKQLAAIDAKLARLQSAGATDPAKIGTLHDRQITISALVNRLTVMRESMARTDALARSSA